MSACEKCWSEAYGRMISCGAKKSQDYYYFQIFEEKEFSGEQCTKQEQDGEFYEERLHLRNHSEIKKRKEYMKIFDEFITEITGGK